MTEEVAKGTLTIKSLFEQASFEFIDETGEWKLTGSAKLDTNSNAMVAFDANVFHIEKTVDGTTDVVSGGVSSTYTPSKGDEALQFNFYNMNRRALKVIGDLVESCTEQLNNLISKKE